MACLIKRNDNGKIVQVTTPKGESSQLFKAIHSIPFLGDTELSASILSNAYTQRVMEMFPEDGVEGERYSNGEPKLFFKSATGNLSESIEEVLLDGGRGEISAGFVNPTTQDFVSVVRFNTDASENSQFLTNQILEGTLSPERVLDEKGDTKFQGKGEYDETREVTAKVFQTNALLDMGMGNVHVKPNGIIDVNFPTEIVVAEKNGEFSAVHLKEVPSLDSKDVDNHADLMLQYLAKYGEYRPEKKPAKPAQKISPESLRTELFNFLKSMGFSVTSLDVYRERYKTLFGADPDIEALTDISNRLVAFAEGKITEENLAEEVAHIALAAYNDQNSIESALVNVPFTPEYAQYAEYYRNKYAPFYEGVDLETQVRKEILGKILAKQFVSGFNTQGLTEEHATVLDRLREIWNQIVNFFKGRYKSFHRRNIDELTAKITDSIFKNGSSEFTNDLSENKDFYYSAMSSKGLSVERQLKLAKETLENTFRALGEKTPRANELERIYDGMTEIDTIRAINIIVDIANTQMSILEAAVKEADAKGEVLSMSEAKRYETLNSNIIPILESLGSAINTSLEKRDFTKKENIDLAKSAAITIKDVGSRMMDIRPIVDKDKDRLVESIWEKMFGRRLLTEEQRAAERAKLEGGMKDLGFFAKLFGLATTSANPVIQLMAYKIVEMRSKVNAEFRDVANPIMQEIYDKGWDKYQNNIIQRDSKGKRTFYFFSHTDWNRLDELETNEKIAEASRLTGKSVSEIEKLAKDYTFRDIIGDADKYKEFLEFTKKQRENHDEKRFTEAYYEKGKERFSKVNVSPETQEILRNFNSRAFEIYRGAMDSNGQIDKAKLSKADKQALANIKREKEIEKSFHDVYGQIREGLRVVRVSDLTQEDYKQLKNDFSITEKAFEGFTGEIVMLAPGRTLESLDERSRTSLDMNNLGLFYRQERGAGTKGEPIDAFIKSIEEIEGKGESAFDWVLSNATLVLSDEYYENIGTSKDFGRKVEEYIESIQDPDFKQELELKYKQYSEANRRRKNLLKQNRRASNPIEVDAKNMVGETRKAIIGLDLEIKEYRREVMQALPEDFFDEEEDLDEEEGEVVSIRELNDDYNKMLTERGIDEYDFCLEHMSLSNLLRVQRFASQITGLFKGNRLTIDNGFDKFVNKMIDEGKVKAEVVDGEIVNKDEVIQQLINEYAKQNVASYFQRFAPEGYGELLKKMEAGEVSMLDVMNKTGKVLDEHPVAKYINISPDYTWTKDIANEEFVNENYKKGGFYRKPKAEFLNDAWFEHYGISKEAYLALSEDDISQLTATKNKEEFELLKRMIKLREMELENYKGPDKYNKWQLVQKSSGSFEKLFSKDNLTSGTALKASLKDIARDVIQNRPDELDHGAQIDGEDIFQRGSEIGVRMIPKYYLDKLEDPEVVTENILEAGILAYRQSLLYRERVAAERDLKALEWKLANQKFRDVGAGIRSRILKKGATTNYAQKGQEYLDHHLYGIQQSRSFKATVGGREIDLTRLATNIQGFARFSNLAYNLYVDVTGATTGMLNKALDTYVGDYYHRSSSKRANSQYLSMSGKFVAEIANPNKKSQMNSLLEEFDVIDPTDKFVASKYGRGAKVLKRSPYLMSKASNMVISPRILLSIINDYRFVDGQFRSFNDFKIYRRGKDLKTIEAEWSSLEKSSLYDYLDIQEGKTSVSQRFKDLYENESQAMEAYSEVRTQITAKAKQVIQNVDSVLNEVDQVAAQRDVITNAFMMHRGWFLINWARRFKPRSFNMAAGQYEEGHYVTLFNAFGQAFKKGEGKKAFLDHFKDKEDFEKRNIKRAYTELGLLAFLLILGEFVLAGDDDDDTWVEDFGRLIYLRTTSEFASSQPIAMPNAVREMATSPFTAIKTYEMLDPTYHIMEGWKSDKDYGFKSARKFVKGTIARRYGQYGDIQAQIDAFRHFNDPTLFNLGQQTQAEMSAADGVKIKD